MKLTDAADRYRTALTLYEDAVAARKDTHAAHIAARTDTSRRRHYKACENAATTRQALDRARDELVDAALEATA